MAKNSNVMTDLMQKYGVSGNTSSRSTAAQPSVQPAAKTGGNDLMSNLMEKYLGDGAQAEHDRKRKLVSDWQKRYNAALDGFGKAENQRNGGYAKDIGGGYASEIDALIRDFDSIKDIAGNYGMAGAKRYLYQLQDLQRYINETNSVMSQFGSEEAYNRYLTGRRGDNTPSASGNSTAPAASVPTGGQQRRTQEQVGADITSVDNEISALQEQIRGLRQKQAGYGRSFTISKSEKERVKAEIEEAEAQLAELKQRKSALGAESDSFVADEYRAKIAALPEKDRKALEDFHGNYQAMAYGYLLRQGYDRKEIDAMWETMQRDKNAELSESAINGTYDWTGQNAGTAVAGFGGARVGNLAGAVTGTFQVINDLARHYLRGSPYSTTDPNSLGYLPSRMAGAADQAVSEAIEGEEGGIVRKGAAFVYRGAANAADNLARMAVATAIGGPAAGATVNSVFSFTQGFQGSYREAVERGGSPVQALLMGSIDGGMEVFTESRTFERWMNLKDPELISQGVYEWLKTAAIGIGNEITEEEASYIANTIADAVVMADKGENAEYIKQAVASGLTPNEAKWELAKKIAHDMAVTAGETAMSTLIMDGVTGSVENYRYKKTYGGSSAELVQEGLESPVGTQSRTLAEQYQEKLDAGKQLTGGELRNMVLANEEQIQAEEAAAEKEETEKQPDPEQQPEPPKTAAPSAAPTENDTTVTLESLSEKYGEYAGAMRGNYLEGQNAEEYDRAFQTAFDMGKSGLNKSALSRVEALKGLTDSQREIAYEIGEAAAAAQAKTQSGKNAEQANGKTGWHKGVVRGEGVKIADLTSSFNDPQRKAYSTLSTIAEATGIDIVLYKSEANSNGEFEGEQGRFRWEDNAIYIDVNAGLKYSKDVGNVAKYAMLRTYGHEFTHFIEKWNPEQYNDFRKAVFNTMENAEDLIETKLAQDKDGTMTYDQASREVVAEAMTDILEDSQFLQELAAKHTSVFDTMKAKLKEFVANLKSYFKSLAGNGSREAKQLKKEVGDSISYLEDIVKRFDAAAVQAVENYQKTVAEDEAETVSEKETVADSDNSESETASERKEEPKQAENDSTQEDSVLNNRTEEQAEAAPAETNEETTEAPTPTAYQGFSITPNTERGTLEITFDSKPPEGVRDALKANKFRWSSKNKLWYGRGDQGRIAEIIDNAMNDRGATSAAGIREKLADESSADEALKQAEKAAKEEATPAEYADLGNKLSYLDSVTVNGLDFRILSSGGDDKVWSGRIDRHPDGPYPVYDARGNIYRSEDFQSRTEAIADVLYVALNNNLLDKQVEMKTEEVINNAETDVQGQAESNDALREDHQGGLSESEQSGEGTARLLDEGEAQPVQQSEPDGTSEPSGTGGEQTGRDGGRPDSERDERGRGAGSSESGDLRGNEPVNDTPEAKQLHETVEREIEQKSTESPKGDNFVIGESLNLSTGEKARFQDNVSALKLIHQLNTEGRLATRAEQEVLAKYVGWGGLSNAFGEMTWNRETRSREMVAKKGWEKEHQELRQLVTDGVITEEEYGGMSESTKNAHYTSMEVIGAMYDGLKGLGFQGGRMLEPSSGVGNFVGGMPADMTATVKSWTMVELDRVTGQIAKYLYPNNDVRIEGFQDANIPDGYMDVAIGNVPFGNYGVVDRSYPKRVTKSIHNYFFAKSLDKVRTGGIVMFITSSFTMNSEENGIRQYIMDRADLLGAIRLPNTAFKGNAGTDVVTDILILKKRAAGTEYQGEAFLDSNAKSIPGSWRAAYVNEYFQNHPEMVLGTEAVTRGMYGAETLTYNPLENAGTLGDQIRAAFGKIDGKMEYSQKTAEQTQRAAERASRKPKEGSYRRMHDGTITNGEGVTVTDTDSAKRIGGLIDVRDAYRNLVERIQQGRTADEIAAARKYLNKVYDSFVKENGYINDPKNKRAIAEDPDRFSIYALETDYRKGGKGESATAKKADIFTKDTIKANVSVNHAETVGDGLIVSINTTGGVDAALIARLTGKSVDEVSRELVDTRMAFKTRDGRLEAPETYLSGNVRAKLREAEALARIDKDYQNNVEELRRVVPKDVPYDEIHVTPGAVWVPTDVYADFIAHMLGGRNNGYSGPDVQVGYSAQTGEYKIKLNNTRLKGNYRNTQEWGTSRKSFLDLFESLMGNGNVTVTDKDIDANGNERRVVNKDETAAAQEKADKIKEEFRKWIWEDEARRTELAKLYNETYNALANPKYDGSDLTVNGINANYSLRPHQANAVKRIIASGGNTLLAHRVGAGKTLEMAAAAMKLRELGIVKKPVFAVPKSLVAQWGVEFHSYFPAAKLLVADDKSFDKANRKVFTNNIANGDFDAVIVSYEQFGKIPMSIAYQQRFLQEQIDEVLDAIAEEKAENGKGSLTVKQMEKKAAQLRVKLEKMKIQAVDADNVDFEALGIDALFVDEAHNFKNLQYSTRMQNVGGLGNSEGSQRAFDLYTKIRYLQQLNGGRGIVFATATPVMNSMAEMYIMQKYLQSDMLKQLGITTFDAWAKQFGEVVNTYEIKPSGQGVRAKQVFSNFKNLNELQLMFRSFSDVLTEVPGLKIPKMRGGGVQIVECEPGKFQKDFMKSLEKRANNVKSVDPSIDNMLKITSDGRKVSYTQRMIDPSLPYEAGCKLYRCCENILKEYKAGKKLSGTDKDGKKVSYKGTQIVFCDMATPKGTDKSKANADVETVIDDVMDTESARLYEDMRDYLVKKGIPAAEIAFIHEANSDAKRKQLFADMNAGKVRVLIGSTGKMGVGMNAQRCVTAIHHLDAPWRPGDVEQRDGRAFRQGNLNDEVAKYVYVTTGSFDARLWDILDRKSGFINQIMNGDDVGRNAEDTGDVTLSAAEVKALASGNPMIKESVELADALQKLNGLKRTHDSAITRARTKLQDDVKNIALLQRGIEARKTDIQNRVDTYTEEKFSMQVGNKTLTDRKDAGEALLSAILYKTKAENEHVEIGSFAGFKILAAKSGSEYSGVMQGAARYSFKVHINNPTLMVGQMAKKIAGLEDDLKAYQYQLEQTIADQAAQEKMIAQPFDRQAELDEKRSRYEFVMSELNKTDQQFGAEDTEQHQARTNTLTDREILAMAAEDIQVDNLDAAEADALQIFRDRLDTLDSLQDERRELGKTYKEQQFGAKVDRAQAAETLKKMHSLDARIQEAEAKVLNAETAPALKKVLPRARRIVEQQQKAKDDVILRRWRDRRNNAAAIKKYRERITKNVTDISNWIISPSNKTDMKHVPDALKNSVIPFITSIDFTSKRQLRGGDATRADMEFMKRLKALNAAMRDNISENGLYSGYNDLPPDFMERLHHFIESTQEIVSHNNGQFVINQMTSQELKELSDIVTALKKHIQDFNRFHANAVFQHVYEAGDATISELGAYQDAKSRSKAGEAMNNFIFWQQIRPAYAFERFGSGGKAIYDGLRRGQAKLAFNTKEIVEFAEAAYTAKEVKEWEESTRTIKIGEKSVTMKVSQIMSFYELLKREQAKGHIFGQGIRVSSFRNGKEQISDVGQTITLEDANRIISVLTPRQIEVADKLQQFMQEKGGEWGNYVSMKRFGEELFGEEHYFPINSDGRHLEANADENPSAASLYALLNMGFTKKLQEKANNRLVLYSIFDVFSNHMASMAQYNSFALPVLDALKWFNYQQKEDVTVMENGSEHVIHEVKDSVRDQLDRVYGVPEETRPGSGKRGYAENFIVGILKAFNGTETQGISSDSPGLNALRHYNMAQVAYNLRVVVQQPMAITRAAMIIDYASILRGMSHSFKDTQKTIDEMRKYSGIAAWKGLGFYDTNISRGLTDIIKHDKSFHERFNDFGMKGAEFADDITWAAMWNACKEEVQRKHDIHPGDEHFFEAVSSLFEEVVYKTQVVDSVLTKNEYLRSKGFFSRATGSFMSEPTATASMLADAFDKYRMDLQKGMTQRQAWERNSRNIGRLAVVYGIGSVILAAAQAVADAFRDDDKYQELGDKWLEAFIGNLIDELMPFNKLPLISDFYDLAKELLSVIGVDTYGYSPSSVWMQWYDSLVKGTEIAYKLITGDEKNRYTWWAAGQKLLQAISGMTGYPAASIFRELMVSWNNTAARIAPSLFVDTYAQKPETEIKYTFLDGHMTAEAARQALVRDAGMSEEEAETKVAALQFQRDNREYSDASESSIGKYLEYCQPEGISTGVFFDVWAFNSNAVADKDENGKSVSGSKKAKVLEYIDSQNLTVSQKDAFYYAFGWSANTLEKDAPWH